MHREQIWHRYWLMILLWEGRVCWFWWWASSFVRPICLRWSGLKPIRCTPCSQEELDSCAAVSSDCPEVLREPGCGCCMSCALTRGESCGVYTAHCGAGLRCVPRPGDTRPLHSLTRGHAVCTEDDQTQGAFLISQNSILILTRLRLYSD